MSLLRGLALLLAGIAIGCGARPLDAHDAAGGTGGVTIGDAGSGRDARPDLPNIIEQPGNCGNGTVDPGEECDDANLMRGDGCGASCQIECYWSCGSCGPPGPCLITPVCGDGRIDSPEACDDGNGADGDGCAADCATIERGWRCPAVGHRCIPTCGDGHVVGPESCDDSNTIAGDGCSEVCLVEPSAARCGDGVVQGAEECDEGMANSDARGAGCTTRCKLGGYCGDSVVDALEQCDLGSDDNTTTYGNWGCTRDCRFAPFCGDAILESDFGEQCDLGARNGMTGQPCDPHCNIWLDTF
jgi:cysteine-rich repeat protein